MTRPHRILIVEDDAEIARMLGQALRQAGFDVFEAENATAFDAVFRREAVDLAILDVMLPGEDGLSICRRIREQSQLPIILLTALGDEVDRIVGLEIGADDYITKPFSPREVVARARSLLRRAGYAAPVTNRPMRFDGWRIDPLRRQLRDPHNARISLTSAEFDLLLALCHNAGRVLSREDLLSLTHAGLAGPVVRSVDAHISRIRQRIEVDHRNPILIKTVRLGGYMFTTTVEEI